MRTDILENRRCIKVFCAIVAIFAYSNTNTIIANTLITFWRIEGAIKVIHARQDCSLFSRGWRKTGCPVPNWRAYNLVLRKFFNFRKDAVPARDKDLLTLHSIELAGVILSPLSSHCIQVLLKKQIGHSNHMMRKEPK